MPTPDRRPNRSRGGATGRPAKRVGGGPAKRAGGRPTTGGSSGSRGSSPRSGSSSGGGTGRPTGRSTGKPAGRSGKPSERSGRASDGSSRRSGPPKRSSSSGGRGRRDDDRRSSSRDAPRLAGDPKWGGVARRGAANVRADEPIRGGGRLGSSPPSKASDAWRAATRTEEWVDEGIVDEAEEAVGRGRQAKRRSTAPVDPEPRDDPTVARAVAPQRLEKFEQKLRDAARQFSRERYEDARRMLKSLSEQAPTAESVRELYGLTLYRMGRWKDAARELEAFSDLSGSVEQHPVREDVHRALGQHTKVWSLWEELRSASPSAELVTEGRIVAAGSLADQGRLDDAIGLLETAKRPTKRPKDHHLRLTYALADLYERSGDVPKARQLFELVARHDPELGDVTTRIRNL